MAWKKNYGNYKTEDWKAENSQFSLTLLYSDF